MCGRERDTTCQSHKNDAQESSWSSKLLLLSNFNYRRVDEFKKKVTTSSRDTRKLRYSRNIIKVPRTYNFNTREEHDTKQNQCTNNNKDTSKISQRLNIKKLAVQTQIILIHILLLLSINELNCQINDSNNSNLNLIEHWKGCQLLGFPNATLNSCGYCVGGTTKLPLNYGQDCNGLCLSDASQSDSSLDCLGICNGDAFVDRCSGTCRQRNALVTKVSSGSLQELLDCRGFCLDANSTSGYVRDECGTCRLSINGKLVSSPEYDATSDSQQNEFSSFKDCAGKCLSSALLEDNSVFNHQANGLTTTKPMLIQSLLMQTNNNNNNVDLTSISRTAKKKAGEFLVPDFYEQQYVSMPMHDINCNNECVNTKSGIVVTKNNSSNGLINKNRNNINDESTITGTCRRNNSNSCLEDPSLCGCSRAEIENGGCFRVKSLMPTLLQSNVAANIKISGYFSNSSNDDLMCLFQHESGEQMSFKLTIETSSNSKNIYNTDSSIVGLCLNVELTSTGGYLFGIGSTKDTSASLGVDNELVVRVVDSQPRLQLISVTPNRLLTSTSLENKQISFTFETTTPVNQQMLAPLVCIIEFENGDTFETKPLASDSNSLTCSLRSSNNANSLNKTTSSTTTGAQQDPLALLALAANSLDSSMASAKISLSSLYSLAPVAARVSFSNNSPFTDNNSDNDEPVDSMRSMRKPKKQLNEEQALSRLAQSQLLKLTPVYEGAGQLVDTPPALQLVDDAFEIQVVASSPIPLATTSFISPDTQTLIVGFDKPLNLSVTSSSSISSAEALSSASSPVDSLEFILNPSRVLKRRLKRNTGTALLGSSSLLFYKSPVGYRQLEAGKTTVSSIELKLEEGVSRASASTISITFCDKMLSKKSVKLLKKLHLIGCSMPSLSQFAVHLSRPLPPLTASIKLSFKKSVLIENNIKFGMSNEREISVELNRIQAEQVALVAPQISKEPRLELTGPSQVPSCAIFSINAHLSSLFGLSSSLKYKWTVELLNQFSEMNSKIDMNKPENQSRATNSTTTTNFFDSTTTTTSVVKWQQLRTIVDECDGANLILDSSLLDSQPQAYKFRLQVSLESLGSELEIKILNLEASHLLIKLDFEAPFATLVSTNLLSQSSKVNANEQFAILADIQVPECASKVAVKQIGIYWQVSDPRIKFDFNQTFSPVYIAQPNSLPRDSNLAFRLNMFYGIRVKRPATAVLALQTSENQDTKATMVTYQDGSLPLGTYSQISDGVIAISVGSDSGCLLSLSSMNAINMITDNTKQGMSNHKSSILPIWSCHNGRSGQPCYRIDMRSASYTRNQNLYSSGTLLIKQQSSQKLVIPAYRLERNAQLWFGLSLYDEKSGKTLNNNSNEKISSSSNNNELFVLVRAHSGHAPLVSVGPVLVSSGQFGFRVKRTIASVRNPLSGSILVPEKSFVTVIGKIIVSEKQKLHSFAWHSPNLNSNLPLKSVYSVSTEFIDSNDVGEYQSGEFFGQRKKQTVVTSELQLPESALNAHATIQLQLSACSTLKTTGAPVVDCIGASLSLSVIPIVSNCQVVVKGAPQVGNANVANSLMESLIVSVENCNFPMSMSPHTYQVYAVDSSSISSKQSATVNNNNISQGEIEDLDEEDKLLLQQTANPISSQQIIPVITLNSINILGLLSIASASASDKLQQVQRLSPVVDSKLRFGVNICNPFGTCKMFFSSQLTLRKLLAELVRKQNGLGDANTTNREDLGDKQHMSHEQVEKLAKLSSLLSPPSSLSSTTNNINSSSAISGPMGVAEESLGAMRSIAKKLNIAGNSAATIAILGNLLTLSSQLILSSNKLKTERERQTVSSSSFAHVPSLHLIVAASALDIVSITSPTQNSNNNSGKQTALVMSSAHSSLTLKSLIRVLLFDKQIVNFKLKYEAILSIEYILRSSLKQQSISKLFCIPNVKTLQSAYFAIYSSLYSLRQILMSNETIPGVGTQFKGHQVKKFGTSAKFSQLLTTVGISSSSSTTVSPTNNDQQQTSTDSSMNQNQIQSQRRDFFRSFSRAVRHAHAAILSASAAQMRIGQILKFGISKKALINFETQDDTNDDNDDNADDDNGDDRQMLVFTKLTYKQEINSSTDFNVFNLPDKNQAQLIIITTDDSKNINLDDDKLATMANNCDDITTCPTIIAVTHFHSLSPFKLLTDTNVKIPIVQLNLLSPVDGIDISDKFTQTLHLFAYLSSTTSDNNNKAIETRQNNTGYNIETLRCITFVEENDEWQPQEQQIRDKIREDENFKLFLNHNKLKLTNLERKLSFTRNNSSNNHDNNMQVMNCLFAENKLSAPITILNNELYKEYMATVAEATNSSQMISLSLTTITFVIITIILCLLFLLLMLLLFAN